MKKALIITGGYLNTERVSAYAKDFDMILAADSGYLTAQKLNISPDIILGDFDSAEIPYTDAEILKVPAEKDETDTMLACTVAVERGAAELLILGGTGGRADHFLSNLFLLESLCDKGISVSLSDGENTLRILRDETTSVPNRGGYFSLFALDTCTVTIDRCKYPLNHYTLTRTHPFAVSNEVIGEAATVTVQGKAILCESSK